MLALPVYAPPPIKYRTIRPGGDLLVTLHEPDARVQHIPEAVIQDVWRCRRFDVANLETTTGDEVEILHPGFLNTDAGPDFTATRLRIGGLAWGGDVEVHRSSGEWLEHRHDADPRYNRVVLHVTLLADRHTGTLRRQDGTRIPEVVLYPHLQNSLRSLLHRFYAYPTLDFHCSGSWDDVPNAVKNPWIRLLGRERIAAKKASIAGAYRSRPDLDGLLYAQILRALGYAKNADPMETLAERVPLARLRTLRETQDVEALLLGTAGLIPSLRALVDADRETADYATDLRERYERLQEREVVPPMDPTMWKRARLRASSLPTRRIAQAAALFGPNGTLQAMTVGACANAAVQPKPLAALRALLTEAEPASFWRTHLRLDRSCVPGNARIGVSHADTVLVNAVLPALLVHAQLERDCALEDAVEALYNTIPAATDSITRRYECRGTKPAHALDAQGLHQLYRTRCSKGRCLSCPIGQWVVGTAED